MRNRVQTILLHSALLFISVIFIYPWLIAISTGIKEPGEASTNFGLIPWEVDIVGNFVHVYHTAKVPLLAFNSLLITVVSVVAILFLSSLAAYAFARLKFVFKEKLYFLILAGLMLQAASMMVPLYQVNLALGILDTYYAVIGPYVALSLPFAILILRSFYEGLPIEIEEAALIDGASRLTIFTRILMPLTRPGLATVGIFTGLGSWNDFVLPMLMTSDPKLKTMPLGLIMFEVESTMGTVEHEYRFALIIMMTLPVILVFLLLQKQFMSGLTAGAVKG